MLGSSLLFDVLTVVAEFSIAWVIYLELEHNRAAEFLKDVHEGQINLGRSRIYAFYSGIPATDIAEHADIFHEKLRSCVELREFCDAQFIYVARLQYMLRSSLVHGWLMELWFPQVVASLWIMLRPYLLRRFEMRPSPMNDYFLTAVSNCLMRLIDMKATVTIYSVDTIPRRLIEPAQLQQMLDDLPKFKQAEWVFLRLLKNLRRYRNSTR